MVLWYTRDVLTATLSERFPLAGLVTEVNLNFSSGSYTEVVIHKGVTKIVDYAFTWSNLTTIYYEGTKEEWEAMDIGKFESPSLTGIEIIYNSTGE